MFRKQNYHSRGALRFQTVTFLRDFGDFSAYFTIQSKLAESANARSLKESHLKLLQVINEPLTDRHQSFLWPLVEPINSGTVSHSRELTTPYTQRGAHGREAQDDLSAEKQRIDAITAITYIRNRK